MESIFLDEVNKSDINICVNTKKFEKQVIEMFSVFFPFKKIVVSLNNSNELDANFNIQIDNEMKFSSNDIKFSKYIDIINTHNVKIFLYESLSSITGKEHPWGVLLGIRPSKIAMNLIKENKSKEEIVDIYETKYLSSREKAELCYDIAKFELKHIEDKERSASLYVSMPFCPSRCTYCSFASYSIDSHKSKVDDYIKSLIKEIEGVRQICDNNNIEINTIYFGGGTPTSVSDIYFEKVMKCIYNNFVYNKYIKEFTVEAGRPDSINRFKLETIKKYGGTRISINPQTMNDNTLNIIGRKHNSLDIIDKFNLAREVGFDNINMDFIIGLPGETLKDVEITCSTIKGLKPESITIHGMSIKRGSTLYELTCNNEKFKVATVDEINKMYSAFTNLALHLNLKPYYLYRQKNMVGNMENIGYSKVDKECIYNIQIIEENQSIIAVGADGISKLVKGSKDITRCANTKNVVDYIKNIDYIIDKKIDLFSNI